MEGEVGEGSRVRRKGCGLRGGERGREKHHLQSSIDLEGNRCRHLFQHDSRVRQVRERGHLATAAAAVAALPGRSHSCLDGLMPPAAPGYTRAIVAHE